MVTRTRNTATERNKTPATKAAGAAARSGKSASRTGTGADTARVKGVGSTPTERGRLIAEAAYYIAERRGFSPGSELEDWLQAEREVDIRSRGSMH